MRLRPRSLLALAAVGLAVLLLAGSVVFAAPPPPGALAATTSTVASKFPTPIQHVFLIMLENAEFGDVMHNGSYERYLASHYAEAGQYYAIEHYSLPNYLAVTSGTVTNYFSVEKAKNLGDLVTAANETWKGEEQSMPTPCDSNNTAPYDTYHNPWIMYADIVNRPARCDAHVVNFTALNASILHGNWPNYSFIVPNRTNDGHDTSVATADAWLRGFLSPLINRSIFRTSVFFITYDEGSSNLGINNGTGGGHVYFAAVSAYSHRGLNSSRQWDDFNVLTTTEWLLGLGHTGKNDNWTAHPPMYGLFSFPNGTVKGPAATSLTSDSPDRASPALERVRF